jgi:hypothetical protein
MKFSCPWNSELQKIHWKLNERINIFVGEKGVKLITSVIDEES